ncbi:MAG: hypothetical protein M3Q69_02980 [Acidobacteriota bacterium]|nr:hypothetical protein [Acidobacteriota bacterium]
MKIVRGRGDARFMPSRYNFALFRLAAFFRLRNARREEREIVLVIDRHQSNGETFLVSSWLMLTLACFFDAVLFDSRPLALPLAFVIGVLGMQTVTVTSGWLSPRLWNAVTRRGTPAMKVNSIVSMSMWFVLAALCARCATWVRFAAWQFFAFVALDVIAAAIVFLLRDPIARLEANFGGVASAQ